MGDYPHRRPFGQSGQKSLRLVHTHHPHGKHRAVDGRTPRAAGKSGLRVGNVSAKQLSSRWKDFRYTAAGARATLT